MPIFRYETTAIDWKVFKADPKLSNHYVTLERFYKQKTQEKLGSRFRPVRLIM